MSKKIFDFEKYPELKPWHARLDKLVKTTYRLEQKFYHTNLEEDEKAWENAISAWQNFAHEYSKVIFPILDQEKPRLLNIGTNKYEKWQKVFKKINDINLCVTIVEQSGGRWRLPPEYYK